MKQWHWYCSAEDSHFGPVTKEELKRLIASGRLTRKDLVWREGMRIWLPPNRVSGLYPGLPQSSSKKKRKRRFPLLRIVLGLLLLTIVLILLLSML